MEIWDNIDDFYEGRIIESPDFHRDPRDGQLILINGDQCTS